MLKSEDRPWGQHKILARIMAAVKSSIEKAQMYGSQPILLEPFLEYIQENGMGLIFWHFYCLQDDRRTRDQR